MRTRGPRLRIQLYYTAAPMSRGYNRQYFSYICHDNTTENIDGRNLLPVGQGYDIIVIVFRHAEFPVTFRLAQHREDTGYVEGTRDTLLAPPHGTLSKGTLSKESANGAVIRAGRRFLYLRTHTSEDRSYAVGVRGLGAGIRTAEG